MSETRKNKTVQFLILVRFLFFRDAIAKALYSTLFSWLVARINQIVRVHTTVDNSIAILDIFGFEMAPLSNVELIGLTFQENYGPIILLSSVFGDILFERCIFRVRKDSKGLYKTFFRLISVLLIIFFVRFFLHFLFLFGCRFENREK